MSTESTQNIPHTDAIQAEKNNIDDAPTSLEKLVRHAAQVDTTNQALVQKNTTLSQEKEYLEKLAKMFTDNRNADVKSNIETHIHPWIHALDIPEEEKTLFLKSIEEALRVDMTKSNVMANFKDNPVWTVACAAGEQHGRMIKELEQLRTSQQNVIEETSKTLENTRKKNEILCNNDTPSILGKRNIQEQMGQNDDMSTSACWSHVFKTMENRTN